MIHEIADKVRTYMAGKKFPLPVVYGPERVVRNGFAGAVVFERDRDHGDAIEPAVGWRSLQDVYFSARVAGVVTVYARSPKPGAGNAHHEIECDRNTDGVLCALNVVCQGFKLVIGECRLLKADEFNDEKTSEAWPGCAARIRFSTLRPVRDVDYTGHGPLTGVVGATSPAVIRADGFPDYDPDPDD